MRKRGHVSEPLKSAEGHTWARIDHNREQRTGLPEVIFAQGKSDEQVRELADLLIRKHGRALATRVGAELGKGLEADINGSVYSETARTWASGRLPSADARVAILSAGTSDLPVAEEARLCAEFFGLESTTHYDIGVAGLDRLLNQIDVISAADVVIAVAGMDGALPTVVAGLVSAPVIAVPTSVGYGASFEGVAPLLTMLSGCAPGVGVVNIDNGFGAAALAAKMLRV